MAFPTLVLAAHGTRLPAGRSTLGSVVMAVRRERPALSVRLAHLDVQSPRLHEVVRKGDVVVPLLLARGHHVGVDVAGVGRLGATAARHLGADDRLVALASQRLDEAGALPTDDVVLVSAGSKASESRLDVDAAAHKLAKLRHTRVTTATVSTVAEVVGALRRRGRVAVATWLVAPGSFSDVVARCRADAIAAPLGLSFELVEIVLSRYDEALSLSAQRLA